MEKVTRAHVNGREAHNEDNECDTTGRQRLCEPLRLGVVLVVDVADVPV